MVDRYRQIVRELARLSSCYVDAQRLWGDLDDDVRNTRYMTREALTSNFNKCYVRSIGKDLSWSALRGQRRKLICVQVFTRTAVALGSAMTFVAGGWWRGILAVLALSILTRPLVWMRARDDYRKARRILDGSEFTEPEVRTLRKLLKSNLHAVPASTLDDPRWRALLEEAISGELLSDDKAHEEVLDIALELAKEYYGSVEELVETSLQLVSMSDQDAGFR